MVKEFVIDIRTYLPSKVIPVIIGLIAIPVITRLFSPTTYGNYVLVLATVTIFSTIAGWLNNAIVRFYPAYERDSKLNEFYATVIKLTFISIGILSLVFWGLLFLNKAHVSTDIYSLMLIGILVFILTSFFQVLLHFLRAKRQVKWYTGFSIWRSITAFGFGIALIIIFDYGTEGLFLGSILAMAVAFPLLWKISIGQFSLKTKGIFTQLTSKIAKYAFPITIGGLAAWILSFSDRYILGLFWSSKEVGIYSACYSISEKSILLLTSLFMLASTPIAMNIWEKEGEEKSKEFVSKLIRYYLIICLPAVIGLSALARPLINVLVAQNYYEGYRILPFVVLGVFFLGLGNRFQLGTLFYRKTHFIMFCTIASGLLNVGLNFLLVPKYGYMAAAITTLVGYILYLILNIVVSRRFFKCDFPFKSLAKATCASAIMGVAVYSIGNNLTSSTIVNLALGVGVGIVLYPVLLFLLREFKPNEIRTVLALKAKILK